VGHKDVNQFTLAVTQFGFIGFLVLNPESVFVYDGSEGDLQAFLHLWAIIGYTLGIDDAYNICLQPDLTSARNFFRDILTNYYYPALFNLEKDTKILVEALIKVRKVRNFVV
jgi:hypothetical protein